MAASEGGAHGWGAHADADADRQAGLVIGRPVPTAVQAFADAPALARRRRSKPLFGLAAAALLLVAIGGAVLRYVGTADAPRRIGAVIPQGFAAALASTHDNCLALGDAHRAADLPAGDLGRVASALRAQLNRPVLAGAPASSGWRFHGARVCTVSGHEAAHLVFVNGPAAVSVFSFAAAACGDCAAADLCEATTAGHALAGFSLGGGVFCVVGSSTDGSLTLDRVRAIRDDLRPHVTACAPADAAWVLAHVQQ